MFNISGDIVHNFVVDTRVVIYKDKKPIFREYSPLYLKLML